MKLCFYSFSPINNRSKKPPFEKIFFGKEVYVLKTCLKKSQKTTEIFFDEASPIITVSTYNTDLKNCLSAYSEKHTDLCKLDDDSEDGRLMFEIEKGRLCFRLTEPYSNERRSAASEFAKKQNHKLRNRNSKN
jgi:hypothetical protein